MARRQAMYYPPYHLVFPKPQTMTTLPPKCQCGRWIIHTDSTNGIPFGVCNSGHLTELPQTMTTLEFKNEELRKQGIPYQKPSLAFQLLHPDSKLPTRATDGSAGLDLYCYSSNPYGRSMVEYDTGVSVAIPEGYVGLVVPRSSITGTALRLANSVAVIDSDYRGPIKLRFDFNFNTVDDANRPYQSGDRIGQLLIIPAPHFSPVAVDELPATGRGDAGFGSSGR